MRIENLKRHICLILVITLLLVIVMQFCQGCAVAPGAKSYAEMTPQERATYVLSVYNDQYDLYLKEAKIPDKTEEKKEVMRQKKKLMQELYPYIGVYADYADAGEFAPEDVEMAVMSIMNKLMGL
jgi:hypothetical protein